MIDIQKIWPAWQIEELIGQGAYGKVYRIRREEFGSTYYGALKVIDIPSDESEVRSLMGMGMDGLSIRDYFEGTAKNIANEIQIMESLKSAANIVHVEEHYLEEHKDSVGWTILIRMELLESMRKYQQREGAPDLKETLKIGKDICRALTYCEEKHVIHRDIKPDNIFRTEFGDYKLGDFGIARRMENTKSVYSQKGTSGYMAPEVNRGEKYDNTVDIYSLGVMLYQMLNRLRLPFVPTDTNRITPQILEEAQWRRLSGEIPPAPLDAPPALAKIILKSISPDPSRRYRNAQQFLDALESYENGLAPVADPEPEKEEPAAPVHWNAPKEPVKPAESAPSFGACSAAALHAAPSWNAAPSTSSSAPQSSQQPFVSKYLSNEPAVSAPAPSAAAPSANKGLSNEEFAKAAARANAAKPKKKSPVGKIILALVLIGVVAFVASTLGKSSGKSSSGSSSSSQSTAESNSGPDALTLANQRKWEDVSSSIFREIDPLFGQEHLAYQFFKEAKSYDMQTFSLFMEHQGYLTLDRDGNQNEKTVYYTDSSGNNFVIDYYPNERMQLILLEDRAAKSRIFSYEGAAQTTDGSGFISDSTRIFLTNCFNIDPDQDMRTMFNGTAVTDAMRKEGIQFEGIIYDVEYIPATADNNADYYAIVKKNNDGDYKAEYSWDSDTGMINFFRYTFPVDYDEIDAFGREQAEYDELFTASLSLNGDTPLSDSDFIEYIDYTGAYTKFTGDISFGAPEHSIMSRGIMGMVSTRNDVLAAYGQPVRQGTVTTDSLYYYYQHDFEGKESEEARAEADSHLGQTFYEYTLGEGDEMRCMYFVFDANDVFCLQCLSKGKHMF